MFLPESISAARTKLILSLKTSNRVWNRYPIVIIVKCVYYYSLMSFKAQMRNVADNE